jgi:signal transduction histidine kinase
MLATHTELHAALLQALVTVGTAAVCWYLYARYRRRELLWWSAAWSMYVLRIGAISAFLLTGAQPWLFVHQVLTGWTALTLLGAALATAHRPTWSRSYAIALVFPLVWSFVAIYELRSFILAAVPAVLFLSFATLWTGWVFFTRWTRTKSRGALFLACVLGVWGLHHLDYPMLRARGAWNPWGYYLDIMFILAMGIGIILLGLEELDKRTAELVRLSSRMVQQHEEERRRLSRELHDQTAQVWAAVKMQLGVVREDAPLETATRLDRVLALIDSGIQSIRGVTLSLRPPLLDDLGLLPALRALVTSFADESGLSIAFDAPTELPPMSHEAGLALFRALQEALSNVARHSGASSARITLRVAGGAVVLAVVDDGRGLSAARGGNGQTFGLAGMRERIGALHGSVALETAAPGTGTSLTVTVPIT